jgi:DNA-binding transcriptional ArsR family regulator
MFWCEDELFDSGIARNLSQLAKEKGLKIKGATAICVYFALCRHVGKDGRCFPSILLLADETDLSPRSVSSAISVLSLAGLIGVERELDGKKHQNNIYSINSCREVARRHGWKLERTVQSPRPEVVNTAPKPRVMPVVHPPVVASMPAPVPAPVSAPPSIPSIPSPSIPSPSIPSPSIPSPSIPSMDLKYPENWGKEICANVSQRLDRLPMEKRQAVLDKFAAALALENIRSPYAYLDKIISNEFASPSIPKPVVAKPVTTAPVAEAGCKFCDTEGFLHIMDKDDVQRTVKCRHDEVALVDILKKKGDRVNVSRLPFAKRGAVLKSLPAENIYQEDSTTTSVLNMLGQRAARQASASAKRQAPKSVDFNELSRHLDQLARSRLESLCT